MEDFSGDFPGRGELFDGVDGEEALAAGELAGFIVAVAAVHNLVLVHQQKRPGLLGF